VPVVTYHNHANTNAMLDYAKKKGRELYESLGATQVFTIEKFGATHNMGTARMGDDPRKSVTNRWGQTHEIPNLFVSDGSLFPTSGSANPTLTIISLMMRQADYLEQQLKRGEI
jgi:choline dehydrogenase-like flavoprotein